MAWIQGGHQINKNSPPPLIFGDHHFWIFIVVVGVSLYLSDSDSLTEGTKCLDNVFEGG